MGSTNFVRASEAWKDASELPARVAFNARNRRRYLRLGVLKGHRDIEERANGVRFVRWTLGERGTAGAESRGLRGTRAATALDYFAPESLGGFVEIIRSRIAARV